MLRKINPYGICIFLKVCSVRADFLDTWPSNIESMSATTVMSSAISTLRQWDVTGGAWNAQNHKSRHLDQNSIWTLLWVGPPPLVGYKNSAVRPLSPQAWLYHRSHSEPVRLPLHRASVTTVATWLEINTPLQLWAPSVTGTSDRKLSLLTSVM